MPLTNSQYNEIMRMYDRRRFANMNRQVQKLQEIYARIPELEQITADIQTASAALTRAKITAAPDLAEKRGALEALRARKAVLLEREGLGEADLAVQYSCPDCRDTGYADGVKCHCLKQAEIDLLYTQSNLKKVLAQENFRSFNPDYYSKDLNPLIGQSNYDYMKSVAAQCWRYAKSFSSSSPSLIFTGDAGVGKSFLTHCIAAEVLNGCNSVMALSAVELFEKIGSRHRPGEDAEAPSDAEYIMDCDLLIIDDLGSETVTQYRISQFFYCLNERLIGSKPTIISTNLPINELRTVYTERIASRIISNYTVYPLYGEDIRYLKKFG